MDKYSYEKFCEWLKNHPEVVSGIYYGIHYKEYNDPKLPSVPKKHYIKKDSEIFGNIASCDKIYYNWKEFYDWLKNHPEIVSWGYYKKHYKEYNDHKLPGIPKDKYHKKHSEIFGNVDNCEKIFYTWEEFCEWLKNHPVESGIYYKKHYKEYNDSKLPSNPDRTYDKKDSEIFGNVANQWKHMNINLVFYTWEEFYEWLKNHPEVVSGIYYINHYKEYNDSKLPSNPDRTYDKKDSEIFGVVANKDIIFYTWEKFYEWLKNHPEIVSGEYYHKHYKEYNDFKLPAKPRDIYKKSIYEIFGNLSNKDIVFYTWEEFCEWFKNHPVESGVYYKKHYKEYNDSKLPYNPDQIYNKSLSEIFGVVANKDIVFYTWEEFYEWLKNHPEVISWGYYRDHYKEYNDPKLPSDPSDIYNKKSSEIFGNISTIIVSEEKRKIFEQRIQISGKDYFFLTMLYGFEMSFDEEKAMSYYKSIGGDVKKIKCFNPNYISNSDGHRFDGFELSELQQVTSSDINSILRFDVQRFFNKNKIGKYNFNINKINELVYDNSTGEYFVMFKNMVISKWNTIQNFKTPVHFKSKKNLTLFQKLTIIDFMG